MMQYKEQLNENLETLQQQVDDTDLLSLAEIIKSILEKDFLDSKDYREITRYYHDPLSQITQNYLEVFGLWGQVTFRKVQMIIKKILRDYEEDNNEV